MKGRLANKSNHSWDLFLTYLTRQFFLDYKKSPNTTVFTQTVFVRESF